MFWCIENSKDKPPSRKVFCQVDTLAYHVILNPLEPLIALSY